VLAGRGTTNAGLGAVFGVREFRYIWFAELGSVVGDQLARVALAVLVYGRTGSALWAAFTYALTFLPALLGGVLLSWMADRYRRREVMITADLLRAGLVGAMAIPRLPLPVLCVLLVGVVLLGSPFRAAQGALLPEVLPGELYERGLAVRQITSQTAQLAGFGAGGVLLAAVSPTTALLADAVTFLVSGALLRLGLADRPAGEKKQSGPRRTAPVFGTILKDRRRRTLLLFAWLIGWYVVPEALAAPYADQLGAGPVAVGLLMASVPFGSVLGAWVFVRFVPLEVRSRLIGVLAVCAGLPLVLCLLRPGLAGTLVLWGLSGAFATAYMLQAQADFVRATPDADRGRAVGLASSGTVAAQGIAVVVGGLLADVADPASAVAVAGLTGALLSVPCAVTWHRAD
jgi:MFS family permease